MHKAATGLFYCERLLCNLQRTHCADRSIRANMLRQTGEGGWTPEAWAKMVVCRGCPIGVSHRRYARNKKPNLPTAPKPPSPRKKSLKIIPEIERCDHCDAALSLNLKSRKCCRSSIRRRLRKQEVAE